MQGFPDGTFQAGKSLTRAEAVTIVNNMFNRGPLQGVEVATWEDVSATHWAFQNIEEASQDHYFSLTEDNLELLQKEQEK